ncbi:MAG: hypothetical protein PQ612_02090 [Rickettsiales bacterium]|nr:hypothetical protein [Pseudomonadota bacterium]MDA0967084.1 hypothetical protein [Pseudomonadota bacterium]MDG4542430.1 hypothetical protein [Rickettsiales bacterium]MDG4544934.1 hypothetical protein [Rickettsiales bacterium]MDG4547057.1 hypothetical protein [Rickettsiales bacterium]
MSRLKGRITKAEKALYPNGTDWVNVTLFYGESNETALKRHLQAHPEDEGKNYIIITRYGNEEHSVGTYEECVAEFRKEVQ